MNSRQLDFSNSDFMIDYEQKEISPPLSPTMRHLKRLVFAMGITMIIGVFFMIYAGSKTLKNNNSSYAFSGECVKEATVPLPNGTLLMPVEFFQHHLIMTIKQDNRYIIITADRCSGNIIQQLYVDTLPLHN